MADTDDIEDLDNQLEKLLKEVENQINQSEDLSGDQRTKKLLFCNKKLQDLKNLLTNYDIELRELTKPAQAPWVKKREAHVKKSNDLRAKLAEIKSSTEREQLGLGKEEKTADEILDEAINIQGESLTSVERSKKIVKNTIEIGENTTQTLVEDGEKMRSTIKDLDDIDTNLIQAKKQLKSIVVGLASDNICRCFMVLILLAIIALIIVVIVKKTGGGGGGNKSPPPSVPSLAPM
eukprot:TRINITY_DN15810_c0_g1_i1.p1 TRINITY_DN15810_c0_g1~~TRINITY_DN15810_c0_g1_i1.p1  ORF type:complete len:235 (+),score=47.55 TRINITY_DN15810_c0_g1_i1:123-827(+)